MTSVDKAIDATAAAAWRDAWQQRVQGLDEIAQDVLTYRRALGHAVRDFRMSWAAVEGSMLLADAPEGADLHSEAILRIAGIAAYTGILPRFGDD